MKLFRIFYGRTFLCHQIGDCIADAFSKAAEKYNLDREQMTGYFVA